MASPAVLARADQLDDLVDVDQGQHQAVQQVQPVRSLAAAELRTAPDDIDAVLEVDLEHLLESQGAGLAVDQRHGIDAERALHRRALVELLEDRLGDEPVLDLDDEVEPLVAVAEVLDVGDALELLGLDELLDRLDDLLGADVVGQLGDDDALASRRDALDACRGPHAERAVAGGVRVADALEPDDLATGGQVGAGDEPHEVVEVGRRMADEVAQRLDDLDEVVRRDVGRHADGDATGTVDQQVGQGGRQHDGLGLTTVVVGLEVDRVLVDRCRHRLGGLVHADLGVAHCRGRIVLRAEVAVPVEQRQPQRPGLHEAYEGVVDRAVAVRVEATHDLTDGPRALGVPAVAPQAHVVHRVEDAPLDGLEPVARVGQGPGVDHRVGVLEEARSHLVAHVGVDDVLLEVLLGSLLAAARHAFSPVLPVVRCSVIHFRGSDLRTSRATPWATR